MKKFQKLLIVLSLTLITSLFLIGIALAMNSDEITKTSIRYADEQIKKQIENEFFNEYASGLDTKKTDFGLINDSFKDSKFGNGIPYSYLSKSFYDSGSDKEIAVFHGYIFPVLMKGKVVATVFAEINNDGKWSIFKVSSVTDIEEKANKAQGYLTNTETAKLILDERFGLSTLVAKNSDNTYRFIPIKDNSKLDVIESKSKSPEDLFAKIKSNKIMNSNEKGGSGNFNNNPNLSKNFIFPSLIALSSFLLAITIWFSKRKRSNS
ncbi:MAG: hypothetical protein A2189_05865 [Paenibacillus sp. RIFOXYA1_FULL_44_5]|nr:MAG: hypothetical protein A2189_05865 [Paenibacillus sp. RIFOXYA1_FULL_44_5]